MQNSELLVRYETYLKQEKSASENTLSSYLRDLRQLDAFLLSRGIGFCEAGEEDLLSFFEDLRRSGKSETSCARFRSTVRGFYRWLAASGLARQALSLENCPHEKLEKKLPEILSSREVEQLLRQPSRMDAKGLRDAAMLELMYATGIRVSELLDLRVSDVDFRAGSLRCCSRSRERFIPMYPYALKTLQDYIRHARPTFLRCAETDSLFVNVNGERMSRQGFWKIVKSYRQKAGIQKEITPHTLRHSFAAHLLENGADMASIQQMMGHADISSTRMYSRLVQNSLGDVYLHAHPRA